MTEEPEVYDAETERVSALCDTAMNACKAALAVVCEGEHITVRCAVLTVSMAGLFHDSLRATTKADNGPIAEMLCDLWDRNDMGGLLAKVRAIAEKEKEKGNGKD